MFFLDKADASDQYGNKTQINAIIVYLSPETMEKINFDNEDWGKIPKDLYKVADVARIESDIETDEFEAKLAGENEVPVAYYLLVADGY